MYSRPILHIFYPNYFSEVPQFLLQEMGRDQTLVLEVLLESWPSRQPCAVAARCPPPAAPRPVPRRDEGGPGCERGGDSGRAVRQGGPGGRRRLREDVAADGLRRRGLSRGECQPLRHGARILPVACPYSGGSQALLALLSGANAPMM